MTLLSVRDLSKAFGGVRAVDGVSFTVSPGEIVALIGPNGAGKTTCFNMLGGQLRPDSGSVALRDVPITGLPPRRVWRLGVGRTFQIAEVFGSLGVRENVQIALIERLGPRLGLRHAARYHREQADALLERVGMSEQGDRPCGALAYGDVKRVELAIALAGSPALLLMDEPTAGMAQAERRALMMLVAAIAREQSIGVLFTEHDMDVVFAHAMRVLVLSRGRLIAAGPPEEVRADPLVQEVYLGAPV